jgi:hypothetical protein
MMETYLAEEDGALDGFELLTIVKRLNERAGIEAVGELADWALPVQEKHLATVCESSLQLASKGDPTETADWR